MKPLTTLALALVALAAPADADAAVFLLFDRPSATPNERVTVRTGNTPASFAPSQRVRPFQRAIRVYLVHSDAAAAVRSRGDVRVHFVGTITPDKNGRGSVTFSAPPLDDGTYAIAYWCPACARFSRGRMFFVQQADQLTPPYRGQARLRLVTSEPCPVTVPNSSKPPRQPRNVPWYGNGLLWAGVAPNGVYAAGRGAVEADGSIFNKLLWVTTPRSRAPKISGVRLDAPAPALRVLATNFGSFSGATDPSFMTPVLSPAAGCWRIRARVADISLTYVVRVVVTS
jgi:hypothetical protein